MGRERVGESTIELVKEGKDKAVEGWGGRE